MKNSNFLKNSIIALLPISLALAVLFGVNPSEPEELLGYDGISLKTMDIDLNDLSNRDIRDYYANLVGKTNSERKGINLLKNLKPILSDGQQYVNYDSGDAVWKLYEITDRDWEKSPASEVTNGTYDASKNIIKNYTFNAPGVDPYIHALYNDRTVENQTKAYASHQQTEHGINREHIWPKSHGFNIKGAGGARGDPMHLWAADGYSNNIHSNDYYGYVDKTTAKCTKDKVGFEYTGYNYSGTSLTVGSGTVFEPQDSDKGDIARAVFYMVARYNNYANETSGIDTNNPNLCLNDIPNTVSETSTYNKASSLGVLSDLLEWNKIDPPDEYEIHRNNLLFNNFTHNRNPFIDFPSWADIAFGAKDSSADPVRDIINKFSDEKVLTSITIDTNPSKVNYVEGETFDPSGMVVKAHYSDGTFKEVTSYTYSPSGQLSSSTKSITVNYEGETATVNISVESSAVHPESIDVNPFEITLEEGESTLLKAIVMPTNTTDKSVTWSSSDDSIATVTQKGYVVAQGPGTAHIYATSVDTPMIYGSCDVKVNDPVVLDRIEISGTYKTEFTQGEVYSNDGIKVTAYYAKAGVDVYNIDVTDDAEFSGFNSSKVGSCTVYANYNGFTDSYVCTITEAPVEENTVIFALTKYGFADTQKVETVQQDDFQVVFDNNGKTTTPKFYTNGNAVRVYAGNTLTISGTKKIVEVTFTFGGGDSTNNKISADTGTINPNTGEWSSVNGSDSVTFTIDGTSGHRRIAEIKVKYNPNSEVTKTLTSISLSGSQKTKFYVDDEFSYSGLVVTAHYSDLSTEIVEPTSVISPNMSTSGSKTVTVYYEENGIYRSATYKITVTALYAVGIEISGTQKTEFYLNEKFSSSDLVVTATMNNGSTKNVTYAATVSSPDMTTLGKKTITVSYQGFTKTYDITVVRDPGLPIEITKKIKDIALENSWSSGTKHSNIDLDDNISVAAFGGGNTGKYYSTNHDWRLYQSEDAYFYIGVPSSFKILSLTVTFSATNNATLTYKGTSITSGVEFENKSGYSSAFFYVGNSSDKTNGVIQITEISATYILATPSAWTLESLSLSGTYKTQFMLNEEFDHDGLIATALYNSGEKFNATNNVSYDGYDTSTEGVKEVTVSYTSNNITKSATYNITIIKYKPVKLELSDYKINFYTGDTFTVGSLVTKCSYSDGTSKTVTPTSVTGYDMNKAGEQEVIVSFTDCGTTVTEKYKINVTLLTPTKIEITKSASKTNFFVGDEFSSAGLEVKATFINESTEVVTPTSISGYDMTKSGNQTVVISYTIGKTTVKTSYSISVIDVFATKLELIQKPSKTSFYVGDTFTSSGLKVKATFNNGSTSEVNPTSISGYDMLKAGAQTVKVFYGDLYVTYEISIEEIPVVLSSISLSGNYDTNFKVGTQFNYNNLIVTVHYSDGSEKTVSEFSVSAPNMSKVGQQDVVVSFTEDDITKTTSYKITIVEASPISISLSGDYQEEFMLADDFNSDGLIVTAHYDNGTSKVVEPTSISGYNMFKEGIQEVLVEYEENGKTVENTYEIMVISPKTISSIKLSGTYQKEFYTSDEFTYEGLKVTAVYSDGTTKDVDSFEVNGFDATKIGYQTITVSYAEGGVTVSTTYNVKLIKLELSYIELSGNYKTEYEVGETYSMEGLIVTAYYNNSTSKVVSPSSISGYKGTKAGNEIIVVSYKENGVEVSTRYVVKINDKETPTPPKEETNLPVIIGAAGGGAVGLGAIITIICVVLKKKH